ncbi:MAG: hypothetical protein JXR96_16850 [Deltaproteobacteria bacterium]|nr:hypothetical protein [Deltaproteobacteria bacterium]
MQTIVLHIPVAQPQKSKIVQVQIAAVELPADTPGDLQEPGNLVEEEIGLQTDKEVTEWPKVTGQPGTTGDEAGA